MTIQDRFAMEPLETRQLLSLPAAMWDMSSAAAANSPPSTVKLPFPIPFSFGLSGTAKGTYLKTSAYPDIGATYTLTGSGKVTPLGSESLTATLRTPGFIANGKLTGSVTLINANGSVTASLTAPAKSPLTATSSVKLTYTVSRATGKYKGTTGTGSATLTLSVPKVLPPTAVGVTAGNFALTFTPGIVLLA